MYIDQAIHSEQHHKMLSNFDHHFLPLFIIFLVFSCFSFFLFGLKGGGGLFPWNVQYISPMSLEGPQRQGIQDL